MSAALSPIDKAKAAAAHRAAEFVETGMKVGLGTGSTAAWLVKRLGERVRDEGLRIKGVPTSSRTAALAREVGIEVVDLAEARWLDICIDGADEVDPEMNLVKGGGGALLQEKIVASAAERFVVIADPTKKVETLGGFPLPVEVVRFGWQVTQALIEEALVGLDVLGREAVLREAGGQPFVTDEGHHILDLHLHRIGDARQLSMVVNQIPGVVENGLFLDMADVLVLGLSDGRVEVRGLVSGVTQEERRALGEPDNLFTEIAD